MFIPPFSSFWVRGASMSMFYSFLEEHFVSFLVRYIYDYNYNYSVFGFFFFHEITTELHIVSHFFSFSMWPYPSRLGIMDFIKHCVLGKKKSWDVVMIKIKKMIHSNGHSQLEKVECIIHVLLINNEIYETVGFGE